MYRRKIKNRITKKKKKKAGEAIAPIVDTLKLFGRQIISSRDHRGSTKSHPEVEKCDLTNPENFLELLMYRVTGRNKTLEKHLQNTPRDANYTSPDI